MLEQAGYLSIIEFRSLARSLHYHRANKNSINDLHILHGRLWGEQFHPHAFERGQIIGWGGKGSLGRKESICFGYGVLMSSVITFGS